MGEGGFLTPPPGFLAGLRKICDREGMLLIIDEVLLCLLDSFILSWLSGPPCVRQGRGVQ